MKGNAYNPCAFTCTMRHTAWRIPLRELIFIRSRIFTVSIIEHRFLYPSHIYIITGYRNIIISRIDDISRA